ncbi:hypothetical protein [Flexibacterium corallicola]|uniref:hypothetical protein n=1 Tax=Flexibacterium corallicola TaxID=3037259 RepID=UPI00286F9439|nr:hypothetical protein [Pseudovibrio sp. M1P-2-3]
MVPPVEQGQSVVFPQGKVSSKMKEDHFKLWFSQVTPEKTSYFPVRDTSALTMPKHQVSFLVKNSQLF